MCIFIIVVLRASAWLPQKLTSLNSQNHAKAKLEPAAASVPFRVSKLSPCQFLREYTKATRLAIEPQSGRAPPSWQDGPHNHLGTVVAARTDGRNFAGEDWAVRLGWWVDDVTCLDTEGACEPRSP